MCINYPEELQGLNRREQAKKTSAVFVSNNTDLIQKPSFGSRASISAAKKTY